MNLKKRHTIILVAIVIGVWAVVGIHPFLAINHPIDGEILVIEGWIPTSYMHLAVEEFKRGKYRHIVTIGNPIPQGSKGQPESNAERAALALAQLGIDRRIITAVSVDPVSHHRTWSFARTFRDWAANSGYTVKAINVFTVDVHARKSLLLFKRALGPNVDVGVISAKHQCYEAGYWWLSHTGIWLTFRNAAGYFYALWMSRNT